MGTLIAHEAGLDAARDQLGHPDPSVTFQHYVGRRIMAPDLRPALDAFFASPPSPAGREPHAIGRTQLAPPDPGIAL